MLVCEESMGLPFVNTVEANAISESMCDTKVGLVRNSLEEHFKGHRMARCCCDINAAGGEEECNTDEWESTFEPDRLMGLPVEQFMDHWEDPTTASWTRHMIVPRKSLYVPAEDVVPEFGGDSAPSLSNWRLTVLKDGRRLKDDR